jgi:hypothetical protein
VPGGTFRKVNVWPPLTVIVTVHPSADASGIAASPTAGTMAPRVTAAILSFRLFNTVAYCSRGVPLVNSSVRSQVGLARTLLAAREHCNSEPSACWISVSG